MTVTPFRGDGEIRVVIQRIDGDSGSLFGRFDEAAGEYHVSRFGDFGATAYTIRPNADELMAPRIFHQSDIHRDAHITSAPNEG